MSDPITPDPIVPGSSGLSPAFDAYLGSLATALELPADERLEVRDEIGAHLADLRAELIDAGLPPERASDEALRRLGPPEILGRELTQARQTRRALLAAVGGATVASGGAAVRGLILGVAAVTIAAVAGALLMAAVTRIFGDGSWTLSDAGWFTAFGIAAFWPAAWLGGRTLVSVAARRSHRPAEQLRPWIAAIGALVVAWVTLVWLRAPQDLWSVIAAALVPVVFVAATVSGTDREAGRSRRARLATLGLFAALLVAIPVLVWIAGTPVETRLSSTGSGPYASMEDMLRATGFDLPGRFVADPPTVEEGGMRVDHGYASTSLGAAARFSTRWHDIRLEAWRASDEGASIDRAFDRPFATSPMTVDSGRFVGAVRIDGTRDVSQWWLVVTGVASDGGRDLIATIGGANSTFTGSAWDWVTAPS